MVACAPVPKARPGSITTASAPAGAASQGGPTQSGPIRTPVWKARQRSSHPGSTSSTAASASSGGTLLRVAGQLDPVLRLAFLEALREELEPAGALVLGSLARERRRAIRSSVSGTRS